jgi:transposase
MRMSSPSTSTDVVALRSALEERNALIESLRSVIASLEGKIAALESALVNHATENQLLKRRLFGPRTERGGTDELQLALGDLLEQQAVLQKQLNNLIEKNGADEAPPPPPEKPADAPNPKGRRDLSVSSLPRTVIELRDEAIERQGGKVIDFESSYELMYVRGGLQVLEKKIARYELVIAGEKTVLGVEAPKKLLRRSMLHTSLVAWLMTQKFGLGVPHYRLEQHMEAQGESVDRSTMCRNAEELGNVLGSTIVHAMFRDSIENCRVLSTDATGAAIQPGPRNGGPKQSCKNGHFFTIVADCDHVLFAYTERHTQEAVAKLFKGFRGFLQSDASNVYDILERGPPVDNDEGIVLVGCFAHCRRYFFDAAICKYAVGLDGLTRLRAIYAADNELARLPPATRKEQRVSRVLPLVDEFFAWAHATARTTPGRNLATKALGYAINQEQELRRVFLDGRIPLDNTRSERALRKVVVGRKNWMFYGSDVHAEAAAALFSIIASCRLHRIDPEQYLDEVMRVLPYWPRERYLELAPKSWRATRASLDVVEIERPIGPITVPVPAGANAPVA